MRAECDPRGVEIVPFAGFFPLFPSQLKAIREARTIWNLFALNHGYEMQFALFTFDSFMCAREIWSQLNAISDFELSSSMLIVKFYAPAIRNWHRLAQSAPYAANCDCDFRVNSLGITRITRNLKLKNFHSCAACWQNKTLKRFSHPFGVDLNKASVNIERVPGC